MTKTAELTDEDFTEIVHKIGKPIFNFIMKRIKKEILYEEKYATLDLNEFLNILIASQATVDVNLLRWMQAFYKIKTNSEIDFNKLKSIYFSRVNEQLKFLLQ